ncbi:MAG: OmpA family protein [Saprospiraceae bacterium]|nr:OmpA family protein [Saprospiraceae bacterium]
MWYPYIAIILSSLFASIPFTDFEVEKMNTRINSPYDEINPVVSLDGKTIYFTRVGHPAFDKTLQVLDQDYSKVLSYKEYRKQLQEIYSQLGDNHNQNPMNSTFNQDIWIAKATSGEFDRIEHPKYPLNSALPNSICAVTTDPSTVVILNQFFKDGSMYKGFSFATKNGEGWHFPEPLHIYDYDNVDPDVNLTLSKDNEIMILSLGRKDSHGQQDLYVSFRIHTNLWSSPVHMGPLINTAFRETTPFISDDKRHLFFASDRAGGMGDSDIFISERLDESWTNWSVPIQLPAPINSPADDGQPFLNHRSGYLYFTSKRDGSSDIFRSRFTKPKAKVAPASARTTVACQIVNSQTGEPVHGKITFGPVDEDFHLTEQEVSKKGAIIEIAKQGILKFYPEKEGFIGREIRLDPSTFSADNTIKLSIDPLVVKGKISLNPIYFMRGKDRILSSSYTELDRLGVILNQHPGLHIRIDGHTDNFGDKWALYQLSENRSIAVKNYLIRRGVQASRIKTKGWGPTRPLTDNSNEELKSQNRRVEVIITKV